MILGTICEHDLSVRPIGIIGEQKGLAELQLAEMMQGTLVGRKGEFQTFANRPYFDFQDGFDSLS